MQIYSNIAEAKYLRRSQRYEKSRQVLQLKIKNKSGFDLSDDGQASPPTQTRRTATPHAGRAILRNRPERQLADRPE